MTLAEGIIYYVLVFIMTIVFILCGCFMGTALRKRKNAKIDDENSMKDSSLE